MLTALVGKAVPCPAQALHKSISALAVWSLQKRTLTFRKRGGPCETAPA
jgi:hypothetical protein